MFWVYSMAVAIQNKNSFNPQARKLKSLQAIWDNDDQNKDRLIDEFSLFRVLRLRNRLSSQIFTWDFTTSARNLPKGNLDNWVTKQLKKQDQTG